MKLLVLLRSILATLFFPIGVLILGPLIIFLHYLLHNRRLEDRLICFWGRLCCWTSGVKVEIEGLENIPQKGCLFLFNHSSFFDIFAIAGYLSGVRFGAKEELFKVPVFAQAMRAAGTLPIARNNREQVYKIYDEARARFAKGEQFALSPEGGRFYGAQLSKFKAGPFIFAMSSGVPVVPVVIKGAYEALPKGEFLFNRKNLRHTVTMKILKPVETRDYTAEQRHDLQNKVYGEMNGVWTSPN